MRPRDLFGVGVRLLAVWFWSQSLYYGYFVFVKSLGLRLGNALVSPNEDAGFMVLYAFLGAVLMGAARALIWVALRRPSEVRYRRAEVSGLLTKLVDQTRA